MSVPGSSVACALSTRGPRQLAVFDLDGTLVDTRRDLIEGLEDAVSPYPFSDASRERAAAALHLGMGAMVTAALGEAAKDPERVRKLMDRYTTTYGARIARHSQLYPEVLATLSWLHSRGVRIAVCSNKPEDLSRLLLRIVGLWDLIPVVVGPESTGKAKPHPDPLLHAVWKSGAMPSGAVLIGDSGIDLECATTAGIDCWIFAGGYDPNASSRASFVFDSFDQLRDPAYWEHATALRRRSSL